jgi:hypothetical protein
LYCETNKPKIQETGSKSRILSSLNQIEFEELLPVFDEWISRKMMYYILKGASRAKKSSRRLKIAACRVAALSWILR